MYHVCIHDTYELPCYLEHNLPQIQGVHLVKSVAIYGMQKLH